MITEGAIGDWSGIYLRENLGSSAAASATGFTGFSLGMAIARLGGDWINDAHRRGAAAARRDDAGRDRARRRAADAAEPIPAVVGFALSALGIANSVPILFSAAGRHEPAAPSLSAVFTVGYTGFIVGPPLIGVLADTIGLPETLALLCRSALSRDRVRRRAGYSTYRVQHLVVTSDLARGVLDPAWRTRDGPRQRCDGQRRAPRRSPRRSSAAF